MTNSTEREALEILQALIECPFADCTPVGREFPALTSQHSIYAVIERKEFSILANLRTPDSDLQVDIKP